LPASAPPVSASLAPTPDPFAAARAAAEDVRAAIAAAKGGPDGLKGKDAKALEDRVNAVERALDAGNAKDAMKQANDLVNRVNDLIRARRLTGQRADQLLSAANALRDAVSNL
jgi:hypothetical protein